MSLQQSHYRPVVARIQAPGTSCPKASRSVHGPDVQGGSALPTDPHRTAHLTQNQVTPVDIKVSLQQQDMTIAWQDDHTSTYSFRQLRRACPCAACRQERKTPAPKGSLPILNIPAGVGRIEVTDARLMGLYAINLIWSDGHNTGIFDYKYLRALDTPESA